ncbi:PilZ domain-containing protein [Sphingomonas piscis]|uniref:PilZ domain-containing protein n=1 Tax=Sphingomonas piscis TaxID=2714943 RepID=A0A6G7YQ46_9SPHN|nr:PilZ domain-containing protein [Sphingomonas piscis]
MLAFLETFQVGGNRRRTERRTLKLIVEGSTERTPGIQVEISNISRTGMLVQTSADLSAGDRLVLELPETGKAEAEVIWSRGQQFGCNFVIPISLAGVSAALLQSPTLTIRSADHTSFVRPSWSSPRRQFLFYSTLASTIAVLIILAMYVAADLLRAS